jgi:hypothetical protein
MAGAGYKLFATGDVLTAAQVNTYLQEQTVMVFANAAARTTALSGVLAEGMVTYLKDTDALEIYSGSAWVGYGSGDITAVSAGTGISVASGTGPIPVVTNSMATEITAAGDIIVGTGSGTFDNLPIGTTGQILTADTTVSPYKVKWATAASGSTFVGASVSNAASQTIANTTETTMTFDTEQFDTDGIHSTSSNTGRMTIPSGKGGKYLLLGMFSPATNGVNWEFYVYVNGSYYITGFPQTGGVGNARGTTQCILHVILNLNAADYVEVKAWQNSGGNSDIRNQYGRYQISYLGA